MVKIVYDFNDAAIARAGTTKDELLKNIRNFVAHRDGAEEPEYGVFTLDKDENDLTLLYVALVELKENIPFRKMFHEVYAYVNGELSRCIESVEKDDLRESRAS